jgi:hypothetical protein
VAEHGRFGRSETKLAVVVHKNPRDLANGRLDVLGKPRRAFQGASLLAI